MTDAEKICRAVQEDTYVGNVAPLLAQEVRGLVQAVADLTAERDHLSTALGAGGQVICSKEEIAWLEVRADLAGRSRQTRDRKLHVYREQIRRMQARIGGLKASLENARDGQAMAKEMQEIRFVLEASDCPRETTTTRALAVMSALRRANRDRKDLMTDRDDARHIAIQLADEKDQLRRKHAEEIARLTRERDEARAALSKRTGGDIA